MGCSYSAYVCSGICSDVRAQTVDLRPSFVTGSMQEQRVKSGGAIKERSLEAMGADTTDREVQDKRDASIEDW